MKFQIAAFADEAGSRMDEQIAAMQENGVTGLEIRGVDGENISNISNEKAKEVKKRLDDAGLAVWSLGSPYGKVGIEEDFGPHLDRFCRGLELAEILQTKHIRLFSFFIPKEKDPAIFRDAVMERLAKFVEKAQGSGVMLCHENEKGIYGDIASRCADIHAALPEIRAVFDPANYIQCKQPTKPAWEMLAPYVEYMHIKDALADGEVVPAGKGIGELPYLLSQFKGSVVSVEPHLHVFEGFAELERDQQTKMLESFHYPSSRAAFGAAVDALKALID